jgi:hypothetical protein
MDIDDNLRRQNVHKPAVQKSNHAVVIGQRRERGKRSVVRQRWNF